MNRQKITSNIARQKALELSFIESLYVHWESISLCIVAEILLCHDSDIEVESEFEIGSTFTFSYGIYEFQSKSEKRFSSF